MHDLDLNSLDVPVLIEDEKCLPHYATEEAAGADVKAYISESMRILPGQSALVPTGIRFALPKGYEIQVRPRSGLALKHSITVLNSPGTIDSDYRGELKVILINHGMEDFVITPGMRIAQIVIAPVLRASFILSSELAATGRGMGGFGHTG